MDADLQNRLIYELKLLTRQKQEYANRLDLLEPYRHYCIKQQRKKGSCYYYIKAEGSGSYIYIGKNDIRIPKIQEAAHLEAALKQIENNITLINSLLSGYKPFDYESVDFLLPKSYRGGVLFNNITYKTAGEKWREEKLAFQKEFPENYPEKKTERASDGTKVKSKNEVIIYNSFLSEGLYHIYELPLPLKDFGPLLYPDFTILSPLDLKTEIIVEHVGRLDDLRYSGDFAYRVRRYILNGYIPGVNLFFTFNDKYGHIDSLQINKVIADILGLR